MKLKLHLSAAIAAAISFVAMPAMAEYPDKAVSLIVPFPPGGSADSIARVMAEKLSIRLKQQFVIVNKPGASANLGSGFVAKSAPDGYTLLIAIQSAVTINPHLYKLNFDPVTDLQPISMMARTSVAIVAGNDSGVTTLKQMVDKAKSQPGKYTFATNGVAGLHRLSAELLSREAGISMQVVPYQGTPGALQDVIGGRVPFGFMDMTASIPMIQAGRIKGLAVTSTTRVPSIPDVPTVSEAGYPGFEVLSWISLAGPKGMSPEIISKLNENVNIVLADPEVQKIGETFGLSVGGNKAVEMQKYFTEESAKWKKVITDAKITVEQ